MGTQGWYTDSAMPHEVTTNEILEAINVFSTHVDGEFASLNKRVTKIEATMVTKDYLDEKLGDLRGDIIVMLRKGDRKLGALIAELLTRKLLDEDAAKRILAMEPFPGA